MATAHKSKNGSRRDAVVNLRMPASVRDLIDEAAHAQGKTRTDFIVDSSRREAVDVVLDRRLITANAKPFDAFMGALAKPPAANAKLRRLFASKSPWEK